MRYPLRLTLQMGAVEVEFLLPSTQQDDDGEKYQMRRGQRAIVTREQALRLIKHGVVRIETGE